MPVAAAQHPDVVNFCLGNQTDVTDFVNFCFWVESDGHD